MQRAGGAYVPINPDHPLERVRLLLEDCGARVVLVDERAATLGESLGETRVLHLERLPQSTGDLPAANVAPSDLAYVIYTSGSTGMPKGVMVEHRSVVNRLNWMQRRYPIGERDASAKDSGDVRRIRLGTVLVELHRRPPVAAAARRREATRGKCCEASSATRSRSSTSCRRC